MVGINFSVGLDGSQSMGVLSNLNNKAKSVGDTFRKEFNQKLSNIISITAIEESIRRTAAWASEIERTSKNIGTTAEQLQTLQHVASKTGIGGDSVTTMFENITKSRTDAISGNEKLIMSFAKLGIGMDELMQSDSTQLFSRVMGSIQNSGDIRVQDNNSRYAVQSITGTPENIIQSFIDGLGGKSFEEKKNTLKSSKDIADEQTIKELSAAYDTIKTSLKEAGMKLMPVATLILNFVNMLIDAIGGVITLLDGGFEMLFSVFSGSWTAMWDQLKSGFGKIFNTLANAVGGFMLSIYDALGLVSQSARDRATFLRKELKKWNDERGVNENIRRRGQALGEAGSMVAGAGTTTIAKGAAAISAKSSVYLADAALGAEKLGLKSTAASLKQQAAQLKTVGTYSTPHEIELMARKNAIREGAMQNNLDVLTEMLARPAYGSSPKLLRKSNELQAAATSVKWEQRLMGARSIIGGAMGTVGAMTSENVKNLRAGTTPRASTPILDPNSPLFTGLSSMGGSSSLRIGGVFGAGESQIVKLNTQMVLLLAQIQKNTNPMFNRAGQSYTQSGLGTNASIGGNAGGI